MKRVVITGMGVVSPVGIGVDEFFKALIDGKNGIDQITHFDTSEIKYKLAAEVKKFDPLKYIDKPTSRKCDLFSKYALYSAYEAVNDSKILGKIKSEDLGVYFGSGIGGFSTLCNEHSSLLKSGIRGVSPMLIPKMICNIAAGNIAIAFSANGPCIALSTACATGTTAIGEAYRAIKDGYTKAAICGGSEAAINPLSVAGFGNALALSSQTDKNCASLPFDKRRSGFVMGEGAGTLVLEEYENAVNRGATIYAEVVGYGSTCDAHHITAPDTKALYSAKAIKDSINGICDISPEKIYINAHGTGTKLNDSCETSAIKAVFKDAAYKLNISSIKSMTGHMLGAAGAVEAIASIMSMNKGIIPPTINYLEKDEECDLNYTPNIAKKAEIDLSVSTSFGFGGHNASLAFKKVD